MIILLRSVSTSCPEAATVRNPEDLPEAKKAKKSGTKGDCISISKKLAILKQFQELKDSGERKPNQDRFWQLVFRFQSSSNKTTGSHQWVLGSQMFWTGMFVSNRLCFWHGQCQLIVLFIFPLFQILSIHLSILDTFAFQTRFESLHRKSQEPFFLL